MNIEVCPKCGRRLGLVRADIVKVGAMLQHGDDAYCGAVLVVTKVPPGPCGFEARLATPAELANPELVNAVGA